MNKDRNIILFLISFLIGLNIIVAVIGMIFFKRGGRIIERIPAVYNIKRIVLEPEFQKYNIIDQKGNIIAILNLQLEDFQHDFQ